MQLHRQTSSSASAKQQTLLPKGDSAARKVVRLIFIIYWLLIFEGVLRKWMFPQANKLFFFVRDPFVLFAYYLAFRHNLWPKQSRLLKAGLMLAALFVPLVLIQSAVLQNNPLVGIYGWRNYFFYIPLAFLIGRVFEGRDLFRLVRQTLLVAVPIAFLVFWQFKSPPGSFINRSYDKEASSYVIVENVVRPTGTFTFNQGQALFASSLVAMLFAVWCLPAKERPLRTKELIICTAAVMANLAFNGSRRVFFAAGFSLIAGCLSAGYLSRKTSRKLQLAAVPIALVFVGGLVYTTVFSEAFSVMQQRQETAEAAEGSTIDRAFHSITSIAEAFPNMSGIGYGIGLGSNAGAFLATGARQFLLHEEEWPRLVDEAGPLGLVYIVYRIAIAAWLVKYAVPAMKRTRNPLPALLLSFLLPLLLVGPLTLQGTANGFGWLFVGFCITANNMGLPEKRRA